MGHLLKTSKFPHENQLFNFSCVCVWVLFELKSCFYLLASVCVCGRHRISKVYEGHQLWCVKFLKWPLKQGCLWWRLL